MNSSKFESFICETLLTLSKTNTMDFLVVFPTCIIESLRKLSFFFWEKFYVSKKMCLIRLHFELETKGRI